VERSTLAARIADVCVLSGSFILRSGTVTDQYFDKYLFEAQPEILAAIAEHLVPHVPKETEVLAGLELGGVPIATALGLATGLPLACVRKSAKGYGTEKLAEGTDVHDRVVLVVEDVVTTGGQVAVSASSLRELGATVTTTLCVIDRSEGKHDLLGNHIELRSLFKASEIS
jgi:orotate phosphoribosyltransferase